MHPAFLKILIKICKILQFSHSLLQDTYTVFEKYVDNFLIVHKTSLNLLWGPVPLRINRLRLIFKSFYCWAWKKYLFPSKAEQNFPLEWQISLCISLFFPSISHNFPGRSFSSSKIFFPAIVQIQWIVVLTQNISIPVRNIVHLIVICGCDDELQDGNNWWLWLAVMKPT